MKVEMMRSKTGGSGWSCCKVARVEVRMKSLSDGWVKMGKNLHSRRFWACQLFLLDFTLAGARA